MKVPEKWKDVFLLFNNPVIKLENKYYMYIAYTKKILELDEKHLFGEWKDILEKQLKDSWCYNQPMTKKCSDIDQYIISLITTRNCNLWCLYCFARGWEEQNNMSFESAKKLIDKLILNQNFKRIKITFFWWEPTLNPTLIKSVVEYSQNIKNKEFSYHVTTNGITSKNMLDFLVENKFWITISSDWYPEIQDRNRPLKNWSKSSLYLEENIKYLIQKWKVFKIRITVTTDIVDKMVDIARYFYDLWCEILHFEPMNTSGRWDLLAPPDWISFAENFIKTLDFAKNKKLKIVNSTYLNLANPSYHYCGSAVWDKLILSPDGTLSACFEVQNKKDFKSSLFCVWQQKDNWELSYNVRNQKKLSELSVENYKKCDDCFAKYICSWWCPVRNFKHNEKDWSPSNYQCAFKKIILFDIIKRIVEESI